jgi:uncharacterized protein YqhQ
VLMFCLFRILLFYDDSFDCFRDSPAQTNEKQQQQQQQQQEELQQRQALLLRMAVEGLLFVVCCLVVVLLFCCFILNITFIELSDGSSSQRKSQQLESNVR